MTGRRWSILCVALALAPTMWLIWAARDFPQLGRLDDGFYWTAARSLAEGREYRIESLPEQPYQTKYPPLYPLLLSAAWRFGDTEQGRLALAALLQIGLFTAFVFAAWYIMRDLVAPRLRFGVTIFVALSPAVALAGLNLLAELPFALLVFVACGIAVRTQTPSSAILAGVAAGFAYLIKTAALPLLIAVPLSLALRRRTAWAALSVIGMLPACVGWGWWTHTHRAADPHLLYYTDYVGYYLADVTAKDIPLIATHGALSLLRATGSFIIFDVYSAGGMRFLTLVCGVFALVGVLNRAGEWKAQPYPLFCAGYSAMLIIWNFPPDERLALPLVPLIAAGFVSQSNELRTVIGSRVAASILVPLTAIWIFVTVSTYAIHVPLELTANRRVARDRDQAFSWILHNVPKEASVETQYHPLLYAYSGRRGSGIMLPPSAFYHRVLPTAATRMLETSAPGYHMITTADHWLAVLPPKTRADILAQLQRPPFHCVFRSDSVMIVRRDRQ